MRLAESQYVGNKQITAWKALCTGFSHSVKYQKSHSFAALTRSISDTAPTRVKIPYARAFHEVISIFIITQVVHALIWSTSVFSLRYEAQK